MSTDAFDERRRALEESYFDKENKEALARLKARHGEKVRLSPITGKPMEQLTVMGVVVERCQDSGGIWLDAGELEQIIESAKKSSHSDWMGGFLNSLLGKS